MHLRRSVLTTCGLALSLSLVTPVASLAQDATPAPESQPMSCDVEARDLDEVVALWFDASGAAVATPAVATMIEEEMLPAGEKPVAADVAAIEETTRQWLYCLDIALQYARGYSLMTDDLVRQFGPDITQAEMDTPEEVRALLEAQLAGTPIPGAEAMDRMPALAGPRKPRLLDDGRIGAIWSLAGNRVYLVYENVDGAWLIDEALDLSEPAQATPTP